MLDLRRDPSRDSCSDRACKRRLQLLGVLASSIIGGLALAQPASADEGIGSAIPEPVLPAVDASTTSLPDPTHVQPEDLLPVVTVTQTEDGNLNVSVRVLSAGTDEAVTQDDSASELVSDAIVGDITDHLDATAPGETTDAREPAGTNTNVSIRVASPGDNGAVNHGSPSAAPVGAGNEEGGSSSSSSDRLLGTTPPSGGGSVDLPFSEEDSAQYQDSNSRYQSFEQSLDDPWVWRWNLTLDCFGNAMTSSTETGSAASLDWTWNWMWDWSCDTAEANGATAEAGGASDISPSIEPRPGDAAAPAPAPAQGGLASGAWAWTWTFDHCGRTTSLSTTTLSQTPLTWAWDWMWSWTCPAGAGGPAPIPTASDSSAPSATDPVAAVLPEPSVLELPVMPAIPTVPALPVMPDVPVVEVPIVAALPELPPVWVSRPDITTPPATMSPIATEVVVTIPAWPAQRAAVQIPRGALGAHPRDSDPVVLPRHANAPTWQHPRRPAREPRVRPAPEARPQATPPRHARDDASPFDLPRPLQAAGSTGTSGGVAPGALLVVIAALTGFVIFAAPELGRRIRVARGLSPRNRHRSPIDHPG